MSRTVLRPGDEILLKTKDGEFTGRISLREGPVIYLHDVVEVATQRSLIGLRSFHKSDIISSKLIGPRGYVGDSRPTEVAARALKFAVERAYGSDSDEKEKPAKGTGLPSTEEPKDSSDCAKQKVSSKFARLKELIEISKASTNPPDLPKDNGSDRHEIFATHPSKKFHHRSNYVVIDSINEIFHNSIIDLKASKSISVAFVGSDVIQRADFSWVVTHSDDLYLYDISSLGKSAFDEGLRDVFQDPNVAKIVYDCRVASHTLFHKHGSFLVNVLDLMALDVMADSLSGLKFSPGKTMSSLLSCLACNLEVDMQEISIQRHRLEKAEESPNYWRQRCTKGDPKYDDYEEMLQAVIFEAVHLKQLRKALADKIIGPVLEATDVLLSSFRDMSGLQMPPGDLYAIPKEFKDGSALKYAAQSCREKTAKLMREKSRAASERSLEDRVASGDGYMNGDWDHNRASTDAESLFGTTPPGSVSSLSSSRSGGRMLLSKLMQDPNKGQTTDGITFAPCGSEASYGPRSYKKAKKSATGFRKNHY